MIPGSKNAIWKLYAIQQTLQDSAFTLNQNIKVCNNYTSRQLESLRFVTLQKKENVHWLGETSCYWKHLSGHDERRSFHKHF